MKIKNKEFVTKFKLYKKAYKNEFEPAHKRYEEAIKDFENSMKDFVIKHITGKKGFNNAYKEAFEITNNSYGYMRVSDFEDVDAKIALEFLINEHLFCLEEKQDQEGFIAT